MLEPAQTRRQGSGQWDVLTMDILVSVGCSPVWEYLVVPVLVLSSIIGWITIPVITVVSDNRCPCVARPG
jgi:hypothetical protein